MIMENTNEAPGVQDQAAMRESAAPPSAADLPTQNSSEPPTQTPPVFQPSSLPQGLGSKEWLGWLMVIAIAIGGFFGIRAIKDWKNSRVPAQISEISLNNEPPVQNQAPLENQSPEVPNYSGPIALQTPPFPPTLPPALGTLEAVPPGNFIPSASPAPQFSSPTRAAISQRLESLKLQLQVLQARYGAQAQEEARVKSMLTQLTDTLLQLQSDTGELSIAKIASVSNQLREVQSYPATILQPHVQEMNALMGLGQSLAVLGELLPHL